jgi:hypothetical protein
VSEVAERHEPHLAHCHDTADGAEVETGGRHGQRAIAHDAEGHDRAAECERRGEGHRGAPVAAEERREQVRRGLAERERTDEHAERDAA